MKPSNKNDETTELVIQSKLPRDVQKRILAIVEESRLSGAEQVDVARELIAHFEDGLAVGKSTEELLTSFGDEHTAAQLIARQKRRPARVEPTKGRDSFVLGIFRNVRYAARRLMKSPGFTVTAVASLGLGIGANIAIFSLVNAVILRQPPLENPDELVKIYTMSPRYPYQQFAYPDFEDLRDGTREAFSGLAATVTSVGQVDRGGTIETLLGELVSGNYFHLLGVQAELGRTFTEDDDVAPGAHPVVVLSHGYWRRAFGGSPGVVGRDLRINGRVYTVVGVAPEDYNGSLRGITPDFYAPVMMYDELQPDTRVILETRHSHRFFVLGRLGQGVTMAQAQVAVDRVAAQFRKDFNWSDESGFLLISLADIIVHPPMDKFVRAVAWLLAGVVGLVLLIACTNLAGFLLARSLDRRKEIAIRLAMGAKRRALVGQILTETTLMSLLGGLAGIGVASGLPHVLTSAELPLPIPIHLDLSIDATVLVFGLVTSVVAGVFLGLVPAFQSTRLDIAPTLKDESAGSGSSRRRLSLRNGLVTAQVAVCLVLLIGAGLFLRSLQQAQSTDPGFGNEPAAMVSVALSTKKYSEEEGRVFMRRMLDRVEQIPGVENAGLTHNMHLNKFSRWNMAIQVDGVEPPPGRKAFTVEKAYVDPGFFEAVGIPILRGRNFDTSDRADTRQVAIVSAAMAEKFWPEEEAISRIVHGDDGSDLVVVGIARDAKILDLSESPRPFIYLPYSQTYSASMEVIARTDVAPERAALEMVAVIRELDPDLIIWDPKTMEQHLGFVLLPYRLSALVLSAFAVLAVVLASVGLYGIVSYAVSQRTREVGIRMSLGANATAVTLLLMRSGMTLVAVGCAAGLVLSYLFSQALSGLLFGIDAFDTWTFLASPLLLLTVAAIAAYVAARRASHINPVNALRAE